MTHPRSLSRPLAALATILLLGSTPLARGGDVPVYSVEGFVVDSTGAPIADAEVRFAPDRERPESTLTALSDADGSFSIEVPRAGASGRLAIEKEGYATTLLDRVPPLSRRVAVGPLALLRPVTLEGLVTNRDGEPIAGTRITISLDPDELFATRAPVVEVDSGADGSFAIADLPPARVLAQFEARGHAAISEWVDLRGASGGARFEVKLGAREPLRGKVVDETGVPIAGATVERTGAFFGAVARATAGDDGRFELAATNAENERFVVRARGRAPQTVDSSRLTSAPITLPFGPRLTVSLEEATGAKAQIVAVHFDVFTKHGEGWKHADGVLRIDDAVVDAHGAWKAGLPDGDRARVRVVAADGRESSPFDLDLAAPPVDGFTVTATLPPLARVEGRVIGPTGQPVPDVIVEIGAPNEASLHPRAERATRTDAEGRFVLPEVMPGSYSVMANGEDALSNPQLLGVTPAKPPSPLELQASVASSVQGALKVNGAAPGRRLAMLGLRYQRVGAGGQHVATLSTHCDPDGTYRLSPLPRGAVVVAPIRPPEEIDGAWHDFRAWIDALDVKNSPNRTNAMDPGRLHLDVVVDHEPRGVLQGRVVVNGEPRSGARIGIRKRPVQGAMAAPAAATEVVISDSSGRYRAVLDGGGEFEVTLFDAALRAVHTLDFEAGSTAAFDLSVVAGAIAGKIVPALPSSGPIRVALESPITEEEEKIRRANPSNLDDTPWVTRAEAAVEEDGSYRFPEVAAGRYRIALDDLSRTLARVASAPFELTPAGIEVEPLQAPRASSLLLVLEKDDSVDERLPFASAKIVAAEGERPLDRTFVGWFVGSDATVDGLPPGRVRVELVVFGKWARVAPQEITIDPDAGTQRLTFRVAPAP